MHIYYSPVGFDRRIVIFIFNLIIGQGYWFVIWNQKKEFSTTYLKESFRNQDVECINESLITTLWERKNIVLLLLEPDKQD